MRELIWHSSFEAHAGTLMNRETPTKKRMLLSDSYKNREHPFHGMQNVKEHKLVITILDIIIISNFSHNLSSLLKSLPN